VPDGRMKAVSLRLSAEDLAKIRRVADRFDVCDSDVIRFAIKSLLARLSPLTDPSLTGKALVPLFLESGTELAHGLALDAQQLERIVNGGAAPGDRVSIDDLHMLAMIGSPEQPQTTVQNADRRSSPMRRYLYEKYLFGGDGAPAPSTGREG
jgi:hypothetical protein